MEIFDENRKTLSPDMPNLVEDAVWQPEQNHYCRTQIDSYKLLPAFDKVICLDFRANYINKTPKALVEFLRGMPISIDGENEWFVKAPLGNGEISAKFKPGMERISFVYYEGSTIEFNAKNVYNAILGVNRVREDFQRLAQSN